MGATKKLRKSTSNLLCSLIYQSVTIALGFILPRVILVGFGSEINGLLNSVTQVIAYMALFEAGIQSVATKSLYSTIAKSDQDATNCVLSAVHANYKRIGALYCAGLVLLSALYPVIVETETLSYIEIFLIVLFSGMGNVVAFFKQGKYRILLIADGREYIITNLNTIISVATNGLKIVLLALHVQVYLVIIMTFLVSLIQVVVIERYMQKQYPWIDLKSIPDHGALKKSKYALVHQISGLVFSNTDMIILTVFCDLKVVSVYAVYKLVVGHIASFTTMPFNSCSFVLGQTFNLDRERYIRLFDGIQVAFNVLVFSILTVTYALLPSFISLYTAGVADAVYTDKYLPILFVVAEVLHMMRVPTHHMVNNCAGRFQETVPQTLTETTINLVCSIVGVYLCGIYGVLLGTIAALLYRTIDFAVYANRHILMRSVRKNLILYGVNGGIFIVFIAVFDRIGLHVASYGQFICAGLLVTIPVMLLYTLLNTCVFRRDITGLLHDVKSTNKS